MKKPVARIYPDSENKPCQGRAAFVGGDIIEPIIARYRVMSVDENRSDILEGLQGRECSLQTQRPVLVFLPLGIIFHDLEGTETLSVYGLTELVHAFINEAQRDFPLMWQPLCQVAKSESLRWFESSDNNL